MSRRAPLAFVASIAFFGACGRTDLPDPFLDPDAVAGEGGSSRGGSAGNVTGGTASPGGTTASGGVAGIGGSKGGSAGNGRAGRGGAAGMGGMLADVCGDGIVGPSEACEPGTAPSAPALEIRQGTWKMPVYPIVGPATATAHYAYDSRSSHTGFEAPEKSSLYLYRSGPESALSLVIVNGIDEDSSGLVQPPSDIAFKFAGLPNTAVVVISDDDVEFGRTTAATALALWDCDRNSDGGVIGGLPFPGSFHLTVTPSFHAGITSWVFLSGARGTEPVVARVHSLDLSQPVEIVASDQPADCRADCTVPRCGDAILDPGEVCDDPNTLRGDGCFGCQPEH